MWKRLAWLYHFTNNGGLSAYKHNLRVTCFCVPNRQAFSWYILSDLKVSTLGLYLKLGLYRMSVYSGFCLDRFNCSFKLRVLNIFCICCNIAWYLLKYNYLTEFSFVLALQARCIRYKIMWWSLSMTCDRLVVFYGYSGFLHQYNWPARYNWNIGESGVKHHKTKPTKLPFWLTWRLHCSCFFLYLDPSHVLKISSSLHTLPSSK